jgi:hypothetical protein
VDGTFREYILVEYQTEPVDGIPKNQLWIRYTGSDTNLSGRTLTLAEIKPVLAEWRDAPVKPKPPDLPGGSFDAGPAMLVMFMLLVLIALFCLGLLLAGLCLAILAVLVGVGIVSASAFVGLLNRSISTGFRALFLQLGALTGLLGGTAATSGIIWITNSRWNMPMQWTIGLSLGLLAGVAFAYLFNIAWSRVAKSLTIRFQRSGN